MSGTRMPRAIAGLFLPGYRSFSSAVRACCSSER
jgi:hypothetical protein